MLPSTLSLHPSPLNLNPSPFNPHTLHQVGQWVSVGGSGMFVLASW